jgi:anti-sigma factor RsiW
MSSTAPNSPQQELDQQLIAYLDGELGVEDAQKLERQLSADPALRQSLNELQTTWDALDQLPRQGTNDHFLKSTIEMVSSYARRESTTRRSRIVRPLAWIAGTAALVALGLWIGFAATRWRQFAPQRQLIEDLQLIQYVDRYRSVDSLEFLEQLDREGLFGEDLPDEAR